MSLVIITKPMFNSDYEKRETCIYKRMETMDKGCMFLGMQYFHSICKSAKFVIPFKQQLRAM